jgi:protein-tyrosine phosphatase
MPADDGAAMASDGSRGRMDDVSPPLRVTAVCSGNICRSPIAEYVLRAAVEEAGLSHAIVVDSAGVGAWHVGDGADRRSVAVLAKHGYDGSAHRVQQITGSWFEPGTRAPDLLLAMDSSHYAALRRMAPDADVAMMRSFDPKLAARPDADLDVPDPYYGSGDGFETVLQMIERATPGVVTYLKQQL